ncbi:hypothetical protein [Cetobacterium sp.]|uniref:hypothetical protein n=1 Tax=Cetobacterium sp. TaxID=2071632 RepID=UPI003EE555F6
MNLKEIIIFIDGKITENYRNRSNYCRKHQKVKQNVNALITGVLYENKDCKVGTIINILNDLGYELTIKEKEPTKK